MIVAQLVDDNRVLKTAVDNFTRAVENSAKYADVVLKQLVEKDALILSLTTELAAVKELMLGVSEEIQRNNTRTDTKSLASLQGPMSFDEEDSSAQSRSRFTREFPFVDAPFAASNRRDLLSWVLSNGTFQSNSNFQCPDTVFWSNVSAKVLMGSCYGLNMNMEVRFGGKVRIVPTHYCLHQGPARQTILTDSDRTFVSTDSAHKRPELCPKKGCQVCSNCKQPWSPSTNPGSSSYCGPCVSKAGYGYTVQVNPLTCRCDKCALLDVSKRNRCSNHGTKDDEFKMSCNKCGYAEPSKDSVTVDISQVSISAPFKRLEVDVSYLSDWVLQGSVDDSDTWVDLRSHQGDTSMRSSSGVGSWALEPGGVGVGFNKFRIRTEVKQTGAVGQALYVLRGFELYGVVSVVNDNFRSEFFKPIV